MTAREPGRRRPAVRAGGRWVPAATWVFLAVGRDRFWSTSTRLGAAPDRPDWPEVDVVVPARDEETVLAVTLPRLLAQDYPGPARVWLVDDRSGDATTAVAQSVTGRLPLRVVPGTERPAGWVGKTWAMRQGLDAAGAGRPDGWVLFTDADISHPPDSLRRLVAHAVADRRDLVSLMARLRADTGWEKLVVPAFVYFFSQLYPFRAVARDRSRTAAAAGGCVLVRRSALAAAGGIDAIAGEIIDDVAMGRAVKRSGGRLWLGHGDRVESIRAYPRLADLWDMVARSAYTQLRHSGWALAGTLAGLTATYLAPPALLAAGTARRDRDLLAAGAVPFFLMTASYLPTLRYYRLSPLRALGLPVAAAIYGAMTADSARRHHAGAAPAWKGRSYPARPGTTAGG